MEVDYSEGINEKDLKLYRTFMNSKIDIFQTNDEYVFRNEKVKQKFYESYEHRQMQDNASKILSSASNLLVYSLAKGLDNLDISQTQLKQVFSKNEVEQKEYNIKYVEKKHAELKRNLMRKKLENDSEYIQLCEFIENPRFHEILTTNRSFFKICSIS